jgi:hypothetical protein
VLAGHAYAEQLYVLDGEFTVWAGESKAVHRPGDNLVIPAGTAHVAAATGSGPGRGLVIALPSGFARLITEVGTTDGGDGTQTSTPLEMELFFRVSAEPGDDVLGPPGALPG